MRELVYYVAVSLDGRISGPGDNFSDFLFEGDHMAAIMSEYADAVPTSAHVPLGITPDRSRFDTVLMGWTTFAMGLPDDDSPYSHLRQVVFSRSHRPTDVGAGVELADEDPVAVVKRLKSEPGSDIWLCGGGKLAGALASEVDRLVLKVNPVVFGAGTPLFDGDYVPRRFDHVRTRRFESGVSLEEYVGA